MTMTSQEAIAKIQWHDPSTNQMQEFILTEGATATIGRASTNEIQIAEQHVSRQHAIITYRDGFFMINDLASSNGTFVNDEPIQAPTPLIAGDVIRLFKPLLNFLAINEGDVTEDSQIIKATSTTGQGSFIITNGPQEGQTIALLIDSLQVGRATSKATWEVLLQDPSVSRPHAQLTRRNGRWFLQDLDSSNGTRVNHKVVQPDDDTMLHDGDKVEFGGSILVFRQGWNSPDQTANNSSDSMTYQLD